MKRGIADRCCTYCRFRVLLGNSGRGYGGRMRGGTHMHRVVYSLYCIALSFSQSLHCRSHSLFMIAGW